MKSRSHRRSRPPARLPFCSRWANWKLPIRLNLMARAQNYSRSMHNRSREVINITEAKANVSISDLSFINGKTTGSVPNDTDFIHSGGAIRSVSTEDLIINRTSIRDSGTEGSEARGGGLFAVGNVTFTESVITGNRSGASGGGVSSLGTVSLDRTTVSDNSANAGGGGGVAANSVIAVDSHIIDNDTSGTASSGGGLRVVTTASFTNSVISGNSTAGAPVKVEAFGQVVL